jgi:predicted small metal-binding protein
MMRVLYCRELVSGCDHIFRAETEEEILRQAEEHSRNVHHIRELPRNLRKKIHRLIHLEKAA